MARELFGRKRGLSALGLGQPRRSVLDCVENTRRLSVPALWIKDKNDLLDVIDHFGRWGTDEDLRRVFESIKDNEEYRLVFVAALGEPGRPRPAYWVRRT